MEKNFKNAMNALHEEAEPLYKELRELELQVKQMQNIKEEEGLKYHHFPIEQLLTLRWDEVKDLKIERSDGWNSDYNGYHEASFSIGADEVGHIFITDTALETLRSFAK